MPVSKAASQMKDKVAEFQRMQQEHMRQQSQQAPRPEQVKAKPVTKATSKDDDYIDFEEVK
jgi:hypothetical protein